MNTTETMWTFIRQSVN